MKNSLPYYFYSLGIILGITLLPTLSQAQTKYTLSGYLKDATNGEVLIGATVYLQEQNTGAAANEYGFYSLTLPIGNYILEYSYLGYKKITRQINLNKNTRLDMEMTTEGKQLQEIVIRAEAEDQNVTSTQMGVTKLEMKEINKLPVLFGERDIIKSIQLTPGVKSAGEGSSGFYVRGGAADQNLILLDEATVYNASHLLGFFSTFNSDALKDVALLKGNAPAEYGGRLSSVLDIKMKDGSTKNFGGNAGIGLISSRALLEGPIVKDKGSFMVSGRRTYLDLFLNLSADETTQNTQLYFYDLNAKANYRLNANNQVYFSGYLGKDKFGFGDAFGFDWGNTTGTFRWNHLFSNRLFSNTAVIYSNYNYNIDIGSGAEKFTIQSAIEDINLKQDFNYYLNPNHTLKFGFNSVLHAIVPGKVTAGETSSISNTEIQRNRSWENAFYVSDEQKVSARLSVNYGLRYSLFTSLGGNNFYTFDAAGNTLDTTYYASSKVVNTYGGLEPRLTATYLVNPISSVKLGYARNRQYLHLLSNSTSSNPVDRWLPSSPNVKPEIADQVSLGYFRNFRQNTYEASVEIYYKGLQNQIDYKNGANLILNETVESQLEYGQGRAYGLELFVKKKTGRYTGWVSYTLARTERQFDNINQGNYYPARQDRTHDLSFVNMFDLTPKWSLSATWVYYSGNAVTYPAGSYAVDEFTVPYYTSRNQSRLPAYHRLDLGAVLTLSKSETREKSLAFSLYNAYGRQNAYTVSFSQNADTGNNEAVRLALFRWIPSVSYNFKF